MQVKFIRKTLQIQGNTQLDATKQPLMFLEVNYQMWTISTHNHMAL